MIYPDVSLTAWLNKYPDLEVKKMRCECKKILRTEIPFINSKGFGITTPKCSCGSLISKSTMILRQDTFSAIIEAGVNLDCERL
jgi:hypothetical protein